MYFESYTSLQMNLEVDLECGEYLNGGQEDCNENLE